MHIARSAFEHPLQELLGRLAPDLECPQTEAARAVPASHLTVSRVPILRRSHGQPNLRRHCLRNTHNAEHRHGFSQKGDERTVRPRLHARYPILDAELLAAYEVPGAPQ